MPGNWTATPPPEPGNYHWREHKGAPALILAVYWTGDGRLYARNQYGLYGKLSEWGGEWWGVPIQEPLA